MYSDRKPSPSKAQFFFHITIVFLILICSCKVGAEQIRKNSEAKNRQGTLSLLYQGSPRSIKTDDEKSEKELFDLVENKINPYALAVGEGGVVYVSDRDHSQIKLIGPDRKLSVVAGSYGEQGFGFRDGKALQAKFHSIRGISFDRRGDLLISDLHNGLIRRLDVDGSVSTFAGNIGANENIDGYRSKATFRKPTSLVVDSTGQVFVISRGSLRRIGVDGNVNTLIPDCDELRNTSLILISQQHCMKDLNAIALDGSGHIVFVDGPRIGKVSSDGEISILAHLSEETVYKDVKNFEHRLGTDLKAIFEGDVLRVLHEPKSIAFDEDRNIYFTMNQTVRRLNRDGSATVVAGKIGKKGHRMGRDSLLDNPSALTFLSAKKFVLLSGNAIVELNLSN